MAVTTSRPSSPPSSSKLSLILIAAAAVLLIVYLVKSGIMRTSPPARGVLAVSSRTIAPDLSVQVVGGGSRSVALASLRGKVVVLHFWATWCPPCRAEFPEFAKFAASSGDQSSWAVLPVSVDDSAAPVGPFLAKIPGQFTVYWDSAGLANALGVSAIPTTVILDKEGRVAWTAQGAADWSPKGVPSIVQSLAHE